MRWKLRQGPDLQAETGRHRSGLQGRGILPAFLCAALAFSSPPARAEPGLPQATCEPAGKRQELNAPPARPLEERAQATGRIKTALGHRKTVNVAGPWLDQSAHSLADYGIVWHSLPRHPGGNVIFLREVYWAYRPWQPRSEAFRFHGPNLDRYLTREPWPTLAEYGPTFRMAFERPDFPTYIADTVERTLAETGADGILLDLWIDKQPAFPAERVRKARVALAKTIRERVGPGAIIMGNVGWSRDASTHAYLNGVFIELWKQPSKRGYSCAELLLMEDLLALHDRKLAQPKLIVFEPWRQTRRSSAADRKTAANLRWAGLFAAMAAVVPRNGYVIYTDNARDRDSDDHGHFYYDIYRTDLGQPTSGATPVAPGVGYRLFARGLVAYNATPREVELQFADRTLTLPPLSGLFCRAEGDGWNCAR